MTARITTCELPHPKWQFDARKVMSRWAERQNLPKHFRSAWSPILYFPYATHPVEKESRQSGFLMPSVAALPPEGNIVGEAYYWAMNRMMDATVGAEYFSLRGWSQRGEIPRCARATPRMLTCNYFGVIDRGHRDLLQSKKAARMCA